MCYSENSYFSGMGKLYFTFFTIIFTFLSCEETPNETILLNEGWQLTESEIIIE